MTSHHIIYEITCTVFMISPPLLLKWHPPYLYHHSDSIDGLRPTLWMTSHPLYVCQLMHSTQRHIHSLWLQTIVVITLHPLHSWHHTPYIGHHTHAIQTLYLPSDPLYLTLHSLSSHPKYRQHHTHPLYDITLPICVATFALYKSSLPHSMTSNHHVYVITAPTFDIVSTLCGCVITSTLLMVSNQLYFWDHIRYGSQYHIHCIRHDTHCMTSQPLLSWHQIPYISHHLQDLRHVVPYSCDITDTLFVNTCNYI